MDNLKLFHVEHKFMSIIWELEPINSTELVKVSAQRLGWKKSTTYTVLKKLCGRGLLRNEGSVVTALAGRDQVRSYESGTLVDRAFDGSLPAFVASFLRDRKLTSGEIEELQRMIREAAQ
jgi:predicted transcriptional regulator